MKEIDDMLNRWIYNSIIRKEFRDLIIKRIDMQNYKCDCGQPKPTQSGKLCMNCGGQLK